LADQNLFVIFRGVSVVVVFKCIAKPDIHINHQGIKEKAINLLIGSHLAFN